jgi:MoxR-like ATPase
MTLRDTNESTIRFDPLTKLDLSVINRIPKDMRVKEFFNKGLFESLINFHGMEKVRSLLEAMQERQVTIGDETFKLPEPFLVLATQNPLEQEGTYPLPEAQLDRFMMKVVINYPGKEEERLIMRQNLSQESIVINPVLTTDVIVKARHAVRDVYMDEKIEKYILDIVFATRNPKENNLGKLQNLISYGGSPRASINLALAAKAYAFIKRRGYVIPEDVRAISHDVLRHRIGLTYEAEAENISTDEVVNQVLNVVEVP